MSAAKIAHLNLLIDKIARALDAGAEHRAIVDRLIREDGARWRFAAGAYELRIAGVGASSTMREAVLDRWMQAALRRIAKERSA